MPLVKQGRISPDAFVHVADDAELPGDGAVLVSAARFLADPETLLRRPASFRGARSANPESGNHPAPPDSGFDRASARPSGNDRRIGVIWPNNRDVDDLVPYLDRLAAVALVFPTFRDGRAYSQARLLRERFGYRGELRATGQVLRDQFVFMLRAGFDAFEVKKDSDAAAFASTVQRYSVFYQPTGDGRVTALHRRMQQHYSEGASL
jgi:uncharacterized protein (DUF934 family)